MPLPLASHASRVTPTPFAVVFDLILSLQCAMCLLIFSRCEGSAKQLLTFRGVRAPVVVLGVAGIPPSPFPRHFSPGAVPIIKFFRGAHVCASAPVDNPVRNRALVVLSNVLREWVERIGLLFISQKDEREKNRRKNDSRHCVHNCWFVCRELSALEM
eukprot:RCo035036